MKRKTLAKAGISRDDVIREAVMIDAYLREFVREAVSLSKHPGSAVIALTWALARVINSDTESESLRELAMSHLAHGGERW